MLLDTSAYKVSNWWRWRGSNPRPVMALRLLLHACPDFFAYRHAEWSPGRLPCDYSV